MDFLKILSDFTVNGFEILLQGTSFNLITTLLWNKVYYRFSVLAYNSLTYFKC